MLNAVIIDDEQNNIDNLSILLAQYCPEVKVLATALDANNGRKIILEQHPDIVFLDIQMPEETGFDLLKSLTDHFFEIIFITAFDKYGIQAVKFAAIDYLLKPIDIDELKEAVQKVLLKRDSQKQNLQLDNFLQLLKQQQQKETHRIALPTSKEIRFVKTQDICRCESSNNYTNFFIVTGEKLLVSKPIYLFEELLKDYGFIRCHQSHLVNKLYIKSWVKEDGGYLLLEGQYKIPVSKQKKDLLKQLL